jgi:hypothetical protein
VDITGAASAVAAQREVSAKLARRADTNLGARPS